MSICPLSSSKYAVIKISLYEILPVCWVGHSGNSLIKGNCGLPQEVVYHKGVWVGEIKGILFHMGSAGYKSLVNMMDADAV